MGTAFLFGNNQESSEQQVDHESTSLISNLLDIKFSDRDEQWRDDFLANVSKASFCLAKPEVSLLSDGYPYLQFIQYIPSENRKAASITSSLEHILTEGFGVSIKTSINNIDWVFSYGDLVNFYLNNEFYTDESIFSKNTDNIKIQEGESILVGQPSETILPPFVRSQLREYLLYSGIKSPKVMLIAKNYENEELVSQDLVFNITPEHFKNKKQYYEVMHTIEWFLPKHYSFLGVEESSVDNGFEAL